LKYIPLISTDLENANHVWLVGENSPRMCPNRLIWKSGRHISIWIFSIVTYEGLFLKFKFACLFIHKVVHLFIWLFIYSIACSFIQLLVHLFNCFFICSQWPQCKIRWFNFFGRNWCFMQNADLIINKTLSTKHYKLLPIEAPPPPTEKFRRIFINNKYP